MKRMMLSTAILAATAFGAHAADDGMFHPGLNTGEFLASNFIGMDIYTAEPSDAASADGVQQNWDNIGEVSDVILSQDGMIDAVVVDVGGFLGMGEHTVALSMDAIKFVADDSTENVTTDYFLVVSASKDELEASPEFDKSQEAYLDTDQPAPGMDTGAASGNDTAMATGTDTGADATIVPGADAGADTGTDTAMGTDTGAGTGVVPGADTSADTGTDTAMGTDTTDGGFTTVPVEQVTADALQGAPVYDASGEEVGEVSKVLIDASGKPAQAVVDVGGVLGIGEKPVALPLAELAIEQQQDSDEIRVTLAQTKEQLEAMPEYDG